MDQDGTKSWCSAVTYVFLASFLGIMKNITLFVRIECCDIEIWTISFNVGQIWKNNEGHDSWDIHKVETTGKLLGTNIYNLWKFLPCNETTWSVLKADL